jgi:DNA (cytosine-5)-methyltransferase 1
MKVLSLFSGVGGFDMGLENAGMQTVFQCEWDKHANTILNKHWPHVPKWEDVSTLTGEHILSPRTCHRCCCVGFTMPRPIGRR